MDNGKRVTIKDWAEDDKPREKMQKYGANTLSTAELLAILIGTGNRELSAVDLCKKLMNSLDNSLEKLMAADFKTLMSVKGIGQAKATTIVAALELARRRPEIPKQKEKLLSSDIVYNAIRHHVEGLDHEELWVTFLNNAHMEIDSFMFSKGGMTSTAFDVRPIMAKALEMKATKMIMFHNHPSNNMTPSRQDKEITTSLKESGKIMNILLLDHLIIGENTYFSFADEGLM